MATGVAAKLPEERRRRNIPERGEWLDLEPLKAPVLPVAKRHWSRSAKFMWRAWRQDPVTGQYGPTEIATVTELAERYDSLKPEEQRIRMDGLGLSLKGKQDRRWRLVANAQGQPTAKPPAKVRKLRVVAEDTKGA